MKKIEGKEKERLLERLTEIEHGCKEQSGLYGLSGGFAVCEVNTYDDTTISVTMKSGVQNDVEDRVYTDRFELDRNTLKVKE
jgi:hypothetical protein